MAVESACRPINDWPTCCKPPRARLSRAAVVEYSRDAALKLRIGGWGLRPSRSVGAHVFDLIAGFLTHQPVWTQTCQIN